MLDNIKKLLENYLFMDSTFDIISLVLPIYLTYRITRYSLDNPRKININEKQFQSVYLPLYKITSKIDLSELSKEDALHLSKRMYSITQKNYELAFPQLHSLLEKLISQISESEDYQPTFNKITYQISLDYEILKKKLGYPSITSLEIFKRKTLKEKLKFVFGRASLIFAFAPFFFPLFMPSDEESVFLFVYLACFALVIIISIQVDKMKD